MKYGICQACKQFGELKELLCPECLKIRDASSLREKELRLWLIKQIHERARAIREANEALLKDLIMSKRLGRRRTQAAKALNLGLQKSRNGLDSLNRSPGDISQRRHRNTD